MPKQDTLQRARRDAQQGKSPPTQAGEFVREQIHDVREGKHAGRSTKQAIAIDLSEARRAGVPLAPPDGNREVRKKAKRDLKAGTTSKRRSTLKRSRATVTVLKKEGHAAVPHLALSRQAKQAARNHGPKAMSRVAQKAAQTRQRRPLKNSAPQYRLPIKKTLLALTCFLTLMVLCAALRAAELGYSPEIGYGPNPKLPPPDKDLIPTVSVAKAEGWAPGKMPTPALGLKVSAFATGFNHPRTLYVLPNGDVLVAETNAPERPEEGKGIKGKAMQLMMKKAGAAVPSANRITLLRDADGDGKAEIRTVFVKDLNSPFGMVLVGDTLYVANTDAVVRFPYKPGITEINTQAQKVTDLPAGLRNHHWTKSLVANRDGSKLYVGVGSNSNAAENGMDVETDRATVLEIDVKSGRTRVFASGLRNPAALAVQPGSGAIWVGVNERDELGDNLVPDYMTAVKDGGFYGWPYSYFGQHFDDRIKPQRPDLVSKAVVPDYALGSHTACLGLVFYQEKLLPQKYVGGVFVGQHGSWNRKPPSGYRVIFVPFTDGKPSGMPEDVLTGFRDDEKAFGRPVGVAVDRTGALLVADDVGNIVWRVTPDDAAKER